MDLRTALAFKYRDVHLAFQARPAVSTDGLIFHRLGHLHQRPGVGITNQDDHIPFSTTNKRGLTSTAKNNFGTDFAENLTDISAVLLIIPRAAIGELEQIHHDHWPPDQSLPPWTSAS